MDCRLTMTMRDQGFYKRDNFIGKNRKVLTLLRRLEKYFIKNGKDSEMGG